MHPYRPQQQQPGTYSYQASQQQQKSQQQLSSNVTPSVHRKRGKEREGHLFSDVSVFRLPLDGHDGQHE